MTNNLLNQHGKGRCFSGFPANTQDYGRLFNTGTQAESSQAIHDLAIAVEQSKDMQMITDRNGVIQYVNPAFEETTGFSRTEVIGMTPAILKSGFHNSDFFAELWHSLLAGHTYSGIMINRKCNGEIFHEEKTISPIRDAAGNITHFFATGKDVTQRVQELEQLQHLANFDCLTGLPNRNLFMDRLQQALLQAARGQQQLALLYLDVDHFKQVNDAYGHATGDELLQSVALRLKQSIRQNDTVARLGGDEFAMILMEISSVDCVFVVLDKILNSFCRRMPAGKHKLATSTSIGISIYPHDGNKVGDLLKCADTAMYRSKMAGGNGYSFYCDQWEKQSNASVEMRKQVDQVTLRKMPHAAS